MAPQVPHQSPSDFSEVLEQLPWGLVGWMSSVESVADPTLPSPKPLLDHVVILISVDESTVMPIVVVGEVMWTPPVPGAKAAMLPCCHAAIPLRSRSSAALGSPVGRSGGPEHRAHPDPAWTPRGHPQLEGLSCRVRPLTRLFHWVGPNTPTTKEGSISSIRTGKVMRGGGRSSLNFFEGPETWRSVPVVKGVHGKFIKGQWRIFRRLPWVDDQNGFFCVAQAFWIDHDPQVTQIRCEDH